MIARKPASGVSLKLSPAILQIIERTMQEYDETTATQIQAKLASYDVYVSLTIILCNRCQMVLWLSVLPAYKKHEQTKTA